MVIVPECPLTEMVDGYGDPGPPAGMVICTRLGVLVIVGVRVGVRVSVGVGGVPVTVGVEVRVGVNVLKGTPTMNTTDSVSPNGASPWYIRWVNGNCPPEPNACEPKNHEHAPPGGTGSQAPRLRVPLAIESTPARTYPSVEVHVVEPLF